MIFETTKVEGVWRISIEAHSDARGFFARTFCAETFSIYGLPTIFEQSSLSHNSRARTLRGMHYQAGTAAEAKLVRCVRGSIFDVALDLRPGSPTEGEWVGETLSDVNGVALYLPPGVAHGFQTLEDDTDVLYQITPPFRPGFGAGVRWNDPAFDISWPLYPPILSERDAGYEDWRP